MNKLYISIFYFFSVTIFYCHAMNQTELRQKQKQIKNNINSLGNITEQEHEDQKNQIEVCFKNEKNKANVLKVQLTNKYLASKNTMPTIYTATLIGQTITLLDKMDNSTNGNLENNFNNAVKEITFKACSDIETTDGKQRFYDTLSFLQVLLIHNEQQLTRNYFKSVQFNYTPSALNIITDLKNRKDFGNHPVIYATLVTINSSFDPDYKKSYIKDKKTETSTTANISDGTLQTPTKTTEPQGKKTETKEGTLNNQQPNNKNKNQHIDKKQEKPASLPSTPTIIGLLAIFLNASTVFAQFHFPQVLPIWLSTWLSSWSLPQ